MANIHGTTNGNDNVAETGNSDTINALAGDDRITVTTGDDVVNGDSGSDTLVVDYSVNPNNYMTMGSPLVANGAGGYDGQFSMTASRRVTFTSIEHFHVTGGGYGDSIMTGNGNDIVSLGGGDDFVGDGRLLRRFLRRCPGRLDRPSQRGQQRRLRLVLQLRLFRHHRRKRLRRQLRGNGRRL